MSSCRVAQAKLRLEMGQERLRQQHTKELEEKESDLESIKASTQKKVGFLLCLILQWYISYSGRSQLKIWGSFIPSLSFCVPSPFFCTSLPSSPLLFLSLPNLPSEVGPLIFSYGVWGSTVSSPSGVWGGAPAKIEFDAL